MSSNAQILSHFGDALGAGFENVLKSLQASQGVGGGKNKKSKSISGGRSRKHHKHSHGKKSKKSRSKSKSKSHGRRRKLGGGEVLSAGSASGLAVPMPISAELPINEVEGGKKTTPWIRHVKAYARSHRMSYRDALSAASASWRSRRR